MSSFSLPSSGSYYDAVLDRASREPKFEQIRQAIETTLNHFNIKDDRKLMSESLLRISLLNITLDAKDESVQTLLKMHEYFRRLIPEI